MLETDADGLNVRGDLAPTVGTGGTSPLRDMPLFGQARVTADYAKCAVQTARELGANMDALGAACGLDLSAEPPAEFPVGAYLRLLDAASRDLNDPLFGLKTGLRSRVTDAKAYALVLLACQDIRGVVEQITRFEPLAHDLGRSEVVVRGGVAYYRLHSPWTHMPGCRQFIDSAASGLCAQASWMMSRSLPVFKFWTTYDRPAGVSQEAYERVLGAPMQFGAEFNQVSFPAMLLSLPLPGADKSLFSTLKLVAERRLAMFRQKSQTPVISEIRFRLGEQMKMGRITLPETAAALRTSPRTLQRKLADSRVTFSELLDDVRREHVQHYLMDETLSLTEVALLLGFSEQSSFNHAFRRWFGVSPTAWRAANANQACYVAGPERSSPPAGARR